MLKECTLMPLNGLRLIERGCLRDERGFFSRFFSQDFFSERGFGVPIQQINHTFTEKKATVRGLHFQHPPYSEVKVVSCLRGAIFDVAVDLRQGSTTFLKWHAEILSAENRRSLIIPQGFAHGFQTLIDECELIYFHSNSYQSQAEDGLYFNDALLDISWPLDVSIISERDQSFARLTAGFQGLLV